MLATHVNAPIAFLRRESLALTKVLPDKLIHLSKARVSNARGSPRGTLMPSSLAAIKLRMRHLQV